MKNRIKDTVSEETKILIDGMLKTTIPGWIPFRLFL